MRCHEDYLPAEIMGEQPVPLYGVRLVVSIGAMGRPAVSWCIDNPAAINRFELAGALELLKVRVAQAQEERIVELRPYYDQDDET